MKIRENVLKTLMDIAQNAVGRDFSEEEKLDFRKELEYKLPDICTGSILCPYEDGNGKVLQPQSCSVETQAGALSAYVCGCESDGIALMLKPEGYGCEIDLAYAEVKYKELVNAGKGRNVLPTDGAGTEDVCIYTYDDPYSEEYRHSAVIRRSDVVKALGNEEQKEEGNG